MKEETDIRILERAFNEVKGFIKEKDRRRKESRWEMSLAKQEFLAEVKEAAEGWFDRRIKTFLNSGCRAPDYSGKTTQR